MKVGYIAVQKPAVNIFPDSIVVKPTNVLFFVSLKFRFVNGIHWLWLDDIAGSFVKEGILGSRFHLLALIPI